MTKQEILRMINARQNKLNYFTNITNADLTKAQT